MKSSLKFLFCLLFFWNSNLLFADSVPYSDSLTIKIESKNYVVIHFHDWSDFTNKARKKMILSDQNPFNSNNNYSYIQCIDKTTGKEIFKKPCSAFTKLQISEDEKYILGISKIMIDNPFQLALFSIVGNLILKRHITAQESKLTKEKFLEFKSMYPKQFSYLEASNRIFVVDDLNYIDFLSMNMRTLLGNSCWSYLYKYSSLNHYSCTVAESVTNWVHWYNNADPMIKFIYTNTELGSISLLDINNKRFEIKIKE